MTSIRTKISVLFICMILGSSLVIISAFERANEQLEESAKTNILLMAENGGRGIDYENSRIEEAVSIMGNIVESSFDSNRSVENPEYYFSEYLPKIDPFIKKITENTKSSTGGYVYFNVEIYKNVFDVWYIIDNDTFIHSPETETMDMFYPENADMVWYYQPMLSEKPGWTNIYYDEILKEDCVSYVKPIFSNGIAIGMVGMDTSFTERERMVTSIKIFDSGHAFVIDENGNVIAGNISSLEMESMPAVLNLSKSIGRGIIDLPNDMLAVYRMGSGQTLIIHIPKSEAFQELNDFKIKASVIGVVFVIFLSIALYFLIGTIISPIKKLRDVATGAGKGNANAEIKIDTNDEIGELANVFNSMIRNIKENEAKTVEYSKGLEKQVQERTNELETRLKELNDTKTAILNMMEDSDETNRELVKTQKNLEETITKLEALDKKKDEFISVAAHELKTPLTSIRGFSQLLQSDSIIKDKDKRNKYLKIIEKETTRLAKLVTDILDLSRIDMGTFKLSEENVDMSKLLEDVSKEADVMAKERGLEFKPDIKGTIPDTIVDRGRLMEILLNLIGNSVKYTPQGSITLSASADNSWIKISIKDTGIGIDKKDQKRLFERFYQVDSSYTRKAGGTGLGLALSKEYLKAMGGDISFSSEFGKGSEFVFRIPIKKPENK